VSSLPRAVASITIEWPAWLAAAKRPRSIVSNREQSVEEFSVAFEGDPKIFGRGFLTATPLLLESRTCFCEAIAELFDDVGYQAVCLFDAAFGVVDEAGLDAVPPAPEFGKVCLGEK
jgi:hypothetical protein